MMSCHQCSSSFNFFKKEVACPKCGFSYCNNCLKFKIQLPDNKKIKVCKNCEQNHLKGKQPEHDSNNERPECSSNTELEKPPPPITVINPKKNAWTDKDLNLLKRLQSLKRKEDETATSITTSDIAIRLANLKGESSVKSYKYVAPPKKTQEEETNELIQRYIEESKLPTLKDTISERLEKLKNDDEENAASSSSLSDNNDVIPPPKEDEVNELMRHLTDEIKSKTVLVDDGNKKDEEIAKRLAKLRENRESNSVDQNLQERTDELIQSYVESNNLDILLSEVCLKMNKKKQSATQEEDNESAQFEINSGDESDISEADSFESTECEICNKEATFVCHTCDQIRYCDKCFREEHDEDDPDEPKHQYKHFQLKKKKK